MLAIGSVFQCEHVAVVKYSRSSILVGFAGLVGFEVTEKVSRISGVMP